MEVSNFERCDTCLSKASIEKMGSLQSYHRILGNPSTLERTQQNQNIPLSNANSSPIKTGWLENNPFLLGALAYFQGRSRLGTFIIHPNVVGRSYLCHRFACNGSETTKQSLFAKAHVANKILRPGHNDGVHQNGLKCHSAVFLPRYYGWSSYPPKRTPPQK